MAKATIGKKKDLLQGCKHANAETKKIPVIQNLRKYGTDT
jgi:hypothetical protein